MVRSVRVKGIGLIAAADLTHPVWMEEIKHVLIPVEGGRFDVPDSAELAPSAAHCSIGPYR
jgi:PHP family Zn ribbon phosphoesterase